MPTNNRHLIRDFFSDSNKSSVDIPTLARLLGMKTFRFREWFDKSDRVDTKLLLAIYATTGVTPEEMGIEGDFKIDISHNPRMLDADQTTPKLLSFYHHHSEGGKKSNYSQLYYEELKEVIDSASKMIKIYDYAVNYPPLVTDYDRRKYFDGVDKYFKALEMAVAENQSLQLQRIFALPLHWKTILPASAIHNLPVLCRTLCMLSDQKFAHLLRCYKSCGDRFTFAITDKPSRAYSVMLIDKSYVIQEYYRIKYDGRFAIPDLLFIDECRGENEYIRLHTMFTNEMAKVGNNKTVSYRAFQLLHKECLALLQESMASLENARSSAEILEGNALEALIATMEGRVSVMD